MSRAISADERERPRQNKEGKAKCLKEQVPIGPAIQQSVQSVHEEVQRLETCCPLNAKN